MTLALRYAARSDVGLVRAGNEDSGYAGPRLLVVADGMGGHAAGELASAAAVATLADMDLGPDEPPPSAVLPGLAQAVDDAGEQIGVIVGDDPELSGMGTTVTGLFWQGERVSIVHVGDSRAYLLRDGELTQLTHDHTYVQTLVDAGRISEDEAATHPRRNLLMRALDGVNPVEPDLSVREARVGDRYLLATDGLTGVTTPDELATILAEGEPTITVTRLVELALERGAPDNVTVVVADVVEVEDEHAAATLSADPVVVGAAGEPRVRDRLPRVHFPEDAQPDPDRPTPAVAAAVAPHVLGTPEEDSDWSDEDEAEHAAAARVRRRRRWVAIGLVAGVVALVVAGVSLAVLWMRGQWYVGEDSAQVVVINGVQGSLVGIPLNRVEEPTGLAVSALPTFDQELVAKGLPAADLDDARRIVGELQARALACQVAKPPLGCPQPSPTPGATTTEPPAPTGSAAPLPTPGPS
jgi:protein phosphatase